MFYNAEAKFKEVESKQKSGSSVLTGKPGEDYVLCLVQILRNGSVLYADSFGHAAGKLFLGSISFKVEAEGPRYAVDESPAFERSTIFRSLARTLHGPTQNIYGHIALKPNSFLGESFKFYDLEDPVLVKTRSPHRAQQGGEEGHDREALLMCGRTNGSITDIICDTRDFEELTGEGKSPSLYWKFELVRDNIFRMFTDLGGTRLYLFADIDPRIDIQTIRKTIQVEGTSEITGEYNETEEICNGHSVYVKDKYPFMCCAMVSSPIKQRGSWIPAAGAAPCERDCTMDHKEHGNCIRCGKDYKSHSRDGHQCQSIMCWAILKWDGVGADHRRRFSSSTYFSECAPDTILEQTYEPWRVGQGSASSIIVKSGNSLSPSDKRPFSIRSKTLALSTDSDQLEMDKEQSASLFEVHPVQTAGNDFVRFRLTSVKYPGCYVGLFEQPYQGNPNRGEFRLKPPVTNLESETSVFEVTMTPLGKRSVVCSLNQCIADQSTAATGLIGICVPSIPQNREHQSECAREISHTSDFAPLLIRSHSLSNDYDSHGYTGELDVVHGLSLNHLSYIPRVTSSISQSADSKLKEHASRPCLQLCRSMDESQQVQYSVDDKIVHITGTASIDKKRTPRFRIGFDILILQDEICPADLSQQIFAIADNGPFTASQVVLLGFKRTSDGDEQTTLFVSHLSASDISRIFLDGVKWCKTNSDFPIELPLMQDDVASCTGFPSANVTKCRHICYLGGTVEKKPAESALQDFKSEKATLLRIGMDAKKYEPKAGVWCPGDRICQLPKNMRPSAPMVFVVAAEAAPDWCDPFDPSSTRAMRRPSESQSRVPSYFGRPSEFLGRAPSGESDLREYLRRMTDDDSPFTSGEGLFDAGSFSGGRRGASGLFGRPGPPEGLSAEPGAGGHRYAKSSFQCASCMMRGPSPQSSDRYCIVCNSCAVCCSRNGNVCPAAPPDAVASTHTISITQVEASCAVCGFRIRSPEASCGRCTVCFLCSVCCTQSPVCSSAASNSSVPREDRSSAASASDSAPVLGGGGSDSQPPPRRHEDSNPPNPPMNDTELLIQEMMAQNADLEIINAVLSAIEDPNEMVRIRQRFGL